MNETDNITSDIFECQLIDDLGYDLVPMYRILFGISCVTVPLGVLLNILFCITFTCRAKKVFNINNHALLLSCLAQALLGIVQGPIRVYLYYYSGCLPLPGTPLCELTVYLDYIPTQINNFLIAQLSIERYFLVTKPFIFRQTPHHKYSLAICLHYIGLFVAIVFPCLYYPIIMQNGASTIDLDDPSQTPTCDLWYARDIYEIFDTLITFAPYFLILLSCLLLMAAVLYRKCLMGGREGRQVGSRRYRRLLFSLNIFLIWFFLTWSPWVLYDFFQANLNLTYSVYIDAVTTFIVYLNYTFSSTIVLITFQEMYQFSFGKLCPRRHVFIRENRVGPDHTIRYGQPTGQSRTIGAVGTIQYMSRGPRIIGVS